MAGEVSLALLGAWRLARLDRTGLAYFDRSLDGFWRSYLAAALSYPPFLLLLALTLPDEQWASSGAARVVMVETISYAIVWIGYPLLLLPLTRFLGRPHRFFDFFVAYNWAQVLESAVLLAANGLAASGILPRAAAGVLVLAAEIAILLYEWFIARVALDVARGPATLVVLVNLVFVVLVIRVAEALLLGGQAGPA